MKLPFQDGMTAVWNSVQQTLDQHHIDIMRLWKRLQELDGGGGRSGSGDTTAYNISQQYRRSVRLTEACHAGVTDAEAIVQQWDAGIPGYEDMTDPATVTLNVNGYFMLGYGFTNEIYEVEFDIPSQQWMVVHGAGNLIEQGLLATTLASMGSGTLTLDRTGTVAVVDTLGLPSTLPIGRKVKAQWSKRLYQWEAIAAGCS